MVKKIIIVLLVAVLGLAVVHTVSAGPWGGYGRGPCAWSDNSGRGPGGVDSEQELALRKGLLDKNWELRSELRKDAPDEKRVEELKKEIYDLREKLAQEGPDAGYRGSGRFGRGYGDCPLYGDRYRGRWDTCWRR